MLRFYAALLGCWEGLCHVFVVLSNVKLTTSFKGLDVPVKLSSGTATGACDQ